MQILSVFYADCARNFQIYSSLLASGGVEIQICFFVSYVWESNLLKRSKCFHKCKGRDCSQPTFTSDSDTRKETANHGALYLL